MSKAAISKHGACHDRKRRRPIPLHVFFAACICVILGILRTRDRIDATHDCVKPRVFVGVFTGPGADSKYTSRRAALRATWFPNTKEELRHIECTLGITFRFVVGHVISTSNSQASSAWADEMKVHGDFLVLDTLDSYRNLSTKTSAYFKRVLSLGAFEYVIKMDDDMFMSPEHLARAVDQLANMRVDYAGCMQQPDVIRNESHVWYEPMHDLLNTGYYMYANGPVYALSRRAILQLFEHGGKYNRLLSNEDASIGLWMLAHDAVFFDDRRLCADECHDSHAFVAVRRPPISWEHGGMANPTVELPLFFGRAECRAKPPAHLPFLKSQFPRFNDMIEAFQKNM